MNDLRRDAPATGRNREPILAVMRRHLPAAGDLLEIAAGTGQHASYFGDAFPDLTWHPTDADPTALPSIDAWGAQAQADNVQPARVLDVTEDPWSIEDEDHTGRTFTLPALRRLDAIVCINMIHIAPWAATEGLMRGAGRLLRPGGVLFMYGPYNVDGDYTAPSNARFEVWLRSLDEQYAIRDIADVTVAARANQLRRTAFVPMPANNFSVVFVRD